MYTLDTNVVIYYIQDEQHVVEFIETAAQNEALLYLSTITETELLRFPALSEIEESRIRNTLPVFSIIPVDSRISQMAGSIGRMCSLKLADSIIAATALFTGSHRERPVLMHRDESMGFQISAAGGRSYSSKNARFGSPNALRSAQGSSEPTFLQGQHL